MPNEKMYWHNYKTGAKDFRELPRTDEDAINYLPQHSSAQDLYRIYRKHKGLSILDAMTAVLLAAAEEKI